MIGQIFPIFSSGRILRQEMLAATADYAFKFGELLYEGYSDGILSGCKLTTTAETIILNRGILCCHGKLYLIKEPIAIPYYPTNTTCVFKIRFLGEMRTDSYISFEMEAVLDEDTTPRDGQLELCRFKLQPGAKLRYEYVDFEDRSTEYDTLITLHSPYSVKGHNTLLPEITQAFAREMLAIPLTNVIDISFCLQALNTECRMSAETIAAYIKAQTNSSEVLSENETLYKGLWDILKAAKNGAAPERVKTIRPRQKLLLD